MLRLAMDLCSDSPSLSGLPQSSREIQTLAPVPKKKVLGLIQLTLSSPRTGSPGSLAGFKANEPSRATDPTQLFLLANFQ